MYRLESGSGSPGYEQWQAALDEAIVMSVSWVTLLQFCLVGVLSTVDSLESPCTIHPRILFACLLQ